LKKQNKKCKITVELKKVYLKPETNESFPTQSATKIHLHDDGNDASD
jgi:hypothetical protein